MSRRVFRIVIVIAIIAWLFLFMAKDAFSKSALIILSSLSFLAFSLCIHGVMGHSIRPPSTKGGLIVFPLLMWVFWAVMFLAFVFFMLPLYCPDFLIAM